MNFFILRGWKFPSSGEAKFSYTAIAIPGVKSFEAIP